MLQAYWIRQILPPKYNSGVVLDCIQKFQTLNWPKIAKPWAWTAIAFGNPKKLYWCSGESHPKTPKLEVAKIGKTKPNWT